MPADINDVFLLGRVGQDPEFRALPSGGHVVTLSLATGESWKDRATGEKRERTEWHRIVVFQPGLVEVIENYVRKGSQIWIKGKLQTRKWQDQSGTDRYTTEVVIPQFGGGLGLLSRPGRSDGDPGPAGTAKPKPRSTGAAGGHRPEAYGGTNDLDDEIPF